MKVAKKEIFSWMMYDFANSAFATTILAVIFNKYFAQVIAGGAKGVIIAGIHLPGAAFFSFTVSVAMVIVAVTAPVLGAIADNSGSKKEFLLSFCLVGVVFTTLLYFVGKGDYWWGALLFIIAHVGFSGGNVFYNAFLPEISNDTTIGRISGLGWALGYIGGGSLLCLNLWMIESPIFPTKDMAIHWCFVSVAFWWFVFTIPLMLFLKERAQKRKLPEGMSYIKLGFTNVWQTLHQIKRYEELVKFLIAYLFYNDGIQTVIILAAIFGAEVLHMNTTELIVFFLVIQATAFVGSLVFGALVDSVGCKNVLVGSLVVWCLVVIWAFKLGIFLEPKTEYWVLGIITGMVLGGSQSASRSLQGMLTPKHKNAEFFGFYAVSGKIATIFGPLVYGIILTITGSLRLGILSLIVFFAIGLFFLLRVDVQKGMNERFSPVPA